ncbi:Acetolactate synthase [Geodia barretti]|uniref:Acetolactate synthase n=1 Tax=Geodia barretti TaxID=519541 RepID=A0AA35SD92_GEOBA|nr:Acetolactate synthase [Geodia barretti]
MKMNGGQMVCESLIREGVDVIFGLPGGAILPLYQTLPEFPALRHILVRHEQGAAHAADGYARVTGRPGVAWATSGPGATNLVTGIATAQMDSVPMVVITGQVGRAAIGSDAFQECDTTGITLPITKHNYLVMSAEEIPRVIKEAFYIANTGRPGPVLVDIPKDVFTEVAEFVYPDEIDLPGYNPTLKPHSGQVRRAAKLIEEAERPVILAGHGVIISRAYDELLELAEKAQIPVITTLLGVSSFPTGHVLSVGWPGMHGMAYASLAIEESDLLIALGMRFDDRITGDTSTFAVNSKKIHGLNKRVKPLLHGDWLARIDELRREHPLLGADSSDSLEMRYVVQAIDEATNGNAVIVTGVGQHQMWAAQYYSFKQPNSLVSSCGSGAMGYEVPGAMGAQVGAEDRVVWSVAGDGGFQMTMVELATLVENNIPVKFAIMNNNSLGMVRQWQDFFYEKDHVATVYSGNPDFVKLAQAFGMLGIRVNEKSQVNAAVERAMLHPGPVIVDFVIENDDNVYPMIPAGMSIQQLIEEPAPVFQEVI